VSLGAYGTRTGGDCLTAAEIATTLGGKKLGSGWLARCPAHDDKEPSLSLSDARGKVLVHCHAGCEQSTTLRSHGFVATTNAGGAKAPWSPEYTDVLRGREVILLPDRDMPGRQRALTIARALLGHVARLIVLDPGDGKDVSEWFERGHSELELIARVQHQEVAG